MKFLQALLVLLGLSLTAALPTKSEAEEKTLSYAAGASQIIATNLLKSYNDIDGNQVHSPLGVTTMLAILAEATQGDTYEEFYKVLGYPKERVGLRDSFKHILNKYQTKGFGTEPSFQTWLYIYRNFSAREDFKKIVEDYYFVDVKDINRDEYDWSEPNTSLELENNSKDVIGFETLKRIKLDDDDDLGLGATTVAAYTDNYGEEIIEKETSKFDRYVDDKQYVEKPQIIEEIKKTQVGEAEKENQEQPAAAEKDVKATEPQQEQTKKPTTIELTEKLENLDEKPVADSVALVSSNDDVDSKDQSKREDDLNLEENETVQDNEKILKNFKEDDVDSAAADTGKMSIPIKEVLESNEPEKVTLPLEKLENVLDEATKTSPAEIMLALESHVSSARSLFGGRSLFQRDDITSALSANSITGREIGSKTKMLLFNGLYFRGNWATQFKEERDTEEFFYMTSEDAMKAPMMHARGKFYMAEMEHLKAKIICIPYENKKYSMMIVLPNELEGLHSVIDKMQPSDYKLAGSLMKEQDLHIVLPKFQIEETSRSESMLKSLGLTKLFSRSEADLSLLSDDRDLHVDEIVQFVNVRVDEGGNSAIALSASDTQARDKESYETVEINHPFLYFVMDCEEEFVLVSGKVHAPELQEELPVTVEVEFEQA